MLQLSLQQNLKHHKGVKLLLLLNFFVGRTALKGLKTAMIKIYPKIKMLFADSFSLEAFLAFI